MASYLEEMRGVLGGAAPQVAVLSEAISTALNTPDESEDGERAEAETRAEAEDEAEDAETVDDEESSACGVCLLTRRDLKIDEVREFVIDIDRDRKSVV